MTRFEVKAYRAGGWVIVDTRWQYPMIGPYPVRQKARAIARAAEFEADPTRVDALLRAAEGPESTR